MGRLSELIHVWRSEEALSYSVSAELQGRPVGEKEPCPGAPASCCCCNPLSHTEWLKATHPYSLTVLEVRNPKISLMGLKSRRGQAGCFLRRLRKESRFLAFVVLKAACIPWSVASSCVPSTSCFMSPDPFLPLKRSFVIMLGPPGESRLSSPSQDL